MAKRKHNTDTSMSDTEDETVENRHENETVLLQSDGDRDDTLKTASTSRGNIYGKYYTFKKEGQEKFGQCILCNQERKITKVIKMKDFNTTGLKKHLQSCHKNVFDSEFGNKVAVKGQQSIKDVFQQINSETTRESKIVDQESFDRMVVKWVTTKYLPFNFFDDDCTQTFFKTINSHFNFPKKDALRQRILSEFDHMKTNLAHILQNNDSKISFTVDGWTSVANKSYYGITAHFIDHNWKLQSLVLDFVPSNGKHTGKDIAKLFFETISSYRIQHKVQGITVDNVAANTKFMSELEILMSQSDPPIIFNSETQHFRCFAHILNLGVQDIMTFLRIQDNSNTSNSFDFEIEDDSGSAQCVVKLRTLFKKIRKSEQLQQKLRSCCETTNTKYLSPNIDVSTRWNSTFDMLQRALHLKSALKILCENNENLTNQIIHEVEWNLICKIGRFLKGFRAVSTELGGEKYSTLSSVIVLFNILIDEIEKQMFELDEKEDRSQLDETLLLAFRQGRDKMLKHYYKTNWIYCASLVVDPRHKVETFVLSQWGKEMKSSSLSFFLDILKTYCIDQNLNIPENTDDTDSDDFYSKLNKYYKQTNVDKWNTEYESYKNTPRIGGKETDILMWWKLHADTYPNIARVAKDILSIPATSVPVERLFSRASLVIRKHRNSLNPESARCLLCLNSRYTCDLAEKITNTV